MSDIEELLARSRELLATTSKSKSKPKRLAGNEVFFFRQTHWYPPKNTRNFERRSIYYPTVLPEIVDRESIVELHYHEPFEACHKKYYCHELGYEPASFDREAFMKIWGFLYDKPIQVENSPFNFRF